MKTRSKTITILLLLALTTSNVVSAQMVVDTQHQGDLNPSFTNSLVHQEFGDVDVLKEDQQGLTLSVQVPWTEIELKEVEVDGNFYTDLSLPGWSETMTPGAPELPFLTEQLGAPVGAGITLEITAGKSHEFLLAYPLLPSATQKVNLPMPEPNSEILGLPEPETVIEKDPLIYDQVKPYPEQVAIVAADGFLRQQRVVGINLFPIQVLPSKNSLVVYESLEVKVLFSGQVLNTVGSKKPESNVYEQLFKDSLLNYQTAQLWRTAQSELTGLTVENSGLNAEMPWTPPNPGWRVKTTSEGIHKLTYAELEAAGLPVTSLNPKSFQLFNNGTEVAIQVVDESDGAFDATDFILFYAQAINSKYTAENVYWLTYGATAQGLRMPAVDGTPLVTNTPPSFLKTEHVENNLYYVSKTPGDNDFDRWMDDYLQAPNTKTLVTYLFDLTAPTASAALFRIAVMGFSTSTINPDHQLSVKLNGTELGEFWFDGLTYHIVEMAVPANLLVAGANILEVTAPNETGAASDIFFLDWVELTYESEFLTNSGILAFDYGIPGTYNYQIASFDTDWISVFDVTDPTIVKKVSGVPIAETGGSFIISFQDTVSTSKSYSVVENSAFLSVKAIEMDTSSSLSLPTNAADYIVITPKAFKTQAETLAVYRSGQGLRTKVVDLQDIYDEFGYGVQDANSIRDFLSYAYHNWEAPAPAVVVLLGDGNYDPKRYVSTSMDNHVPVYLGAVDPWIIETAADNRYVTFIGEDTLPDMMLGRLTANDVAEAEILVNKIIAYEASTSPDPWKQKVLFVADNADSAGNFAQLSDNLIGCCLPDIYQPSKIHLYLTHATVSGARAAIINNINQGVLFVNYIGHAAYTQWTDEGIFRLADINLLTNADRFTVILSMTCFEGYYLRPRAGATNESMAEVFTGSLGKGAVASWSPTGLGVASGHDYLNRGFFDAVFKNGATTIGEGTAAGKLRLWSTGRNLDLLDTYLLFGDPATRLPIVYQPDVSSIPGQTIYLGQSFASINLDDNVIDYDNPDDQIVWTYSGNTDLVVEIINRVVTITLPNSNWVGTETITFRATDPDGYFDEVTVNFTILEWPFEYYLPINLN